MPVTPSRSSASGEASAADSAIATNDCAPVITADSAIASTPVRQCRIPRGLRGSATCASSSSSPSGAGGTWASSPSSGSESSTTVRMGDDDTAGTATPVNDEAIVTTEHHGRCRRAR